MFKFRSLFVLGLLLSVLTVPAFCEEVNPQLLEKTQELARIIKIDELINTQAEAITTFLIQQQPTLANHKEEVSSLLHEMLNPNDFSQFIVKVHMDNFDEKDIQEMIKFYQTPTGQKTIEKLPVITQETRKYVEQVMTKNKDKMEALVQKIVTEETAKKQAS